MVCFKVTTKVPLKFLTYDCTGRLPHSSPNTDFLSWLNGIDHAIMCTQLSVLGLQHWSDHVTCQLWMQDSGMVLVQNSSEHARDYFSSLISVVWTESWQLIKKLNVVIVFNDLKSRRGQCTCYACHSSNNIIGDFYRFFLSKIFTVIVSNKYIVKEII